MSNVVVARASYLEPRLVVVLAWISFPQSIVALIVVVVVVATQLACYA